ncbi:MAG: VWA domain-containing protein [Cyanobacteria bacterium J06642_11]
MKQQQLVGFLAVGLSLSVMVSCSTISLSLGNSPERVHAHLAQRVLPNIQMGSQLVSDTEAYNTPVPAVIEPALDPNTYPLYGAQPTNDNNIVYIEIYSSAEKANGARKDERWLVDVAEAFNQQQQKLPSGQTIQVGVRNIPSGLGAQMLAAGKGKPAGYSPAHALWLELIKADGLAIDMVHPALVSNQAILAMHPQVYRSLAKQGEVSFDRVLDAILSGDLKVGYCNPYIASPGLNFLYTLLWRSAGHHQDGQPLTMADVESPEVASVFEAFQKQVTLTAPTYLDLKQIWLRDLDAFEVIVMSYQSYAGLKQQPGFDEIAYVPFGIAETSPLVNFDWTTATEKAALEQFAAFATSDTMQTLGEQQGHEQTPYLKQGNFPPMPSGDVLKASQALWKQRKDGGRTVYMELVVDTSGSMNEQNRLGAVKEALRFASQQINAGNQVGLITFNGQPTRRIHLAPFGEFEKKRLFTAIDQLHANGNTALYDGLAVGLESLLAKQKLDPDGKFYLLLLTDGERTQGLKFNQIKGIIEASGVRIYPIAYGDIDQQELEAIAEIRESTVYQGTPEKVQVLLKNLFQTSL